MECDRICHRCLLLAEAEEVARLALASGRPNSVWHYEALEVELLEAADREKSCPDCIGTSWTWIGAPSRKTSPSGRSSHTRPPGSRPSWWF